MQKNIQNQVKEMMTAVRIPFMSTHHHINVSLFYLQSMGWFSIFWGHDQIEPMILCII